jgi:chromosome segregation ATPase
METRRTLRQQRNDAIVQRDEALKRLEDLAETTSTKQFNVSYLTRQLDDYREQVDSLTRKLAASPNAQLRDARRELMLARRANEQLQERLTGMQTNNESLYRQLAGLRLAKEGAAR